MKKAANTTILDYSKDQILRIQRSIKIYNQILCMFYIFNIEERCGVYSAVVKYQFSEVNFYNCFSLPLPHFSGYINASSSLSLLLLCYIQETCVVN